MMKRTLIIAGCAASWLSTACAQPTPAVPPTPPLPVQPPSATTAPPEQIAPRDGATDNGTTMSDRLSRQQGAVEPPGNRASCPFYGAPQTCPLRPRYKRAVVGVVAAPVTGLPPPGPYPCGRDAIAALGAVEAARKAVGVAERIIRQYAQI